MYKFWKCKEEHGFELDDISIEVVVGPGFELIPVSLHELSIQTPMLENTYLTI